MRIDLVFRKNLVIVFKQTSRTSLKSNQDVFWVEFHQCVIESADDVVPTRGGSSAKDKPDPQNPIVYWGVASFAQKLGLPKEHWEYLFQIRNVVNRARGAPIFL